MTRDEFFQKTLGEARIAVCVGCGGVGKTTVSAALGLAAARRGRNTLILTIDPARRLADSLGIGELGNQPRPIPSSALSQFGVPPNVKLSAMMLDMKRTFDDLITRFASSPEARDRILSNTLYQHASETLAGSVEYSAMEKVYELYEGGEFDLIVLDTPPSQHALDFLEAPQRLVDFLDSRIIRLLVHPALSAGRIGLRLFQRGAQRALQTIERVTGLGFLEDVSEFLLAFEGMSGDFRKRAQRVESLLTGPEASFVLVTGPAEDSVAQSVQFLDRLENFRVPLHGILVNRIHDWPGSSNALPTVLEETPLALEQLTAALAHGAGADFPAEEAARAAFGVAKRYAEIVRRDEASTSVLRKRTEEIGRYWGRIPEFAADVHNLAGLAQVADRMVLPEENRGAPTPHRPGEEPDA
ncbi:AAA family ATPase [Myxococcota bacterium]|nr:AAA family ATPase [Myxococcota bacterium]